MKENVFQDSKKAGPSQITLNLSSVVIIYVLRKTFYKNPVQ